MKTRAVIDGAIALTVAVMLTGCSAPAPAEPHTKASTALLSKCTVIIADLNRLTTPHKLMDHNIPVGEMKDDDLNAVSEDFVTMHLDVTGLRKSEEKDLQDAAAEAQQLILDNRARDGRITNVAKLDLAAAALRYDCS
jgi:hypothetical protein